MIAYSVGPDSLNEYNLSDVGHLEWLVYHYENWGYEGDGEAIGFDGEKLYVYNLGHCSCYGPLESVPVKEISLERFKCDEVCLDESQHEEVNKKVRELLCAA